MSLGLGSRITALVAAGVTGPPAPRPRWLRRGRFDFVFLADLAAALICFGATNGVLGTQNAHHNSPHSNGELLLVSLMLCAPLVLRTRFPLTAWTASLIAMLWTSRLITPQSLSGAAYIPAGVIVYALCLYAVAVRCKAWVAFGAGLVTIAAAAWINPPTTVMALFFAAVSVFAGVIVRSRRGSREQLEVAERRHEGERTLLEERQRIARELHDVVAHHMSVIAIQAEAAPYKTADPPPELVESFGEIRASALSGLSELRRVLGVLRSDRPDVAPQPGLEDLGRLVDSARTGGVTVTTAITGTPGPLPAGVDLSAYRIVQEALSNAMRHAPGSAVHVRLYYGEAALVIEVRNNGVPHGIQATQAAGGPPGRAGLGNGGGHGIIGMRERAAMLGGHLKAGPTANDEFVVTAALPLANDRLEDTP
ncbi:MAG TPA: histidine kinase [Streptosporangiaceae bacterium]